MISHDLNAPVLFLNDGVYVSPQHALFPPTSCQTSSLKFDVILTVHRR